MIKRAFHELLYWWRKRKASDEQCEYLPDSHNEYIGYVQMYGIAPGDTFILRGDPVVITEIEGEPDMNATVHYKNIETDVEQQTGLAGLLYSLGT